MDPRVRLSNCLRGTLITAPLGRDFLRCFPVFIQELGAQRRRGLAGGAGLAPTGSGGDASV